MLAASLERYGADRSILSDKNGTVIAGNKTLLQWAEMGMEEIISVHTTGQQLVNVVRDDLDLATDPAAIELALADNRVSQVDLDYDLDALKALIEHPAVDVSPFWFPDETAALLAGPEDTPIQPPEDFPEVDESIETEHECPKCGYVWSGGK